MKNQLLSHLALVAVFFIVVIFGPPFTMSNDEIIAEVKKCKDADLIGQVIFDKQKRYVIGVQCITTIKEAIEQPTGWEA